MVKNAPFNKYIADIQHPDNSVYTPVCCGKKGFKDKNGKTMDLYNFEKNKIIDDALPENPEKPKPDKPKEQARNYISDKTPTDIERYLIFL